VGEAVGVDAATLRGLDPVVADGLRRRVGGRDLIARSGLDVAVSDAALWAQTPA
jgi:hypothetical protein